MKPPVTRRGIGNGKSVVLRELSQQLHIQTRVLRLLPHAGNIMRRNNRPLKTRGTETRKHPVVVPFEIHIAKPGIVDKFADDQAGPGAKNLFLVIEIW